mgnify:CR=1 FL=1
MRNLEDSARISQLNIDEYVEVLSKTATEVRSPVDGVVSNLKAQENYLVDTDSSLLEIIDADDLRIIVEIPEYNSQTVKLGQNVKVRQDISDDDKIYDGEITKISRLSTTSSMTGENVLEAEVKTNEIISDNDSLEIKKEMRTVKEFLEDRFNKEYVYKNVLNKPSSITVSEIKKMIQEEDEEKHQKYYKENFVLKTPSFIHQGEEKVGFNSAEKGTIFHLAMQLLDFSKFDTEDASKIRKEVKLQINSFVEKNIMSLDEAETININWIVKFIQSDIFKEIYIANKSEKLFKEKAIDYNIKLKNLFRDENISEDEKIMVVGIIDLFFENENGEIILLDYKTDYVTKENLEEVKERYKVQLDLYKSAIEDISGKKVAKKGLYLFGINEFVEI